MDTSETNIKMCEKAEEIQEGHQPSKEATFIRQDGGVVMDGGGNIFFIKIPGESFVWLPHQDELQEMLPEFIERAGFVNAVANSFADFVNGELYALPFRTFEQFWLAFVMKEKYDKIWTGEDWINGNSDKD